VFENLPTPGSNNNKKQKEQRRKQDFVIRNEDRVLRQKYFTQKA
jgi:hypothetical protein